jgi:toxin ParE1/3/4
VTLRIYGPAQADIEAAFDYIAQVSPRAAQVVVERILTALEALIEHPEMGRPGRVDGTRELVIARTPYVAVYEVTTQGVAVVRVIHGARNWPADA